MSSPGSARGLSRMMNKVVSMPLVLGVVVLAFCALLASLGPQRTWRLWNIHTMEFPFADMRVITAGAESRAQGLDPLVANPSDPKGRAMNYPRVWQGLYHLGVTSQHTLLLGLLMAACFLAGLCVAFPRLDLRSALVVVGAVLSPSTLLGVERGNTDLAMFGLVAVAAGWTGRNVAVSTALILFAFILKLYPLAAVIAAIVKRRRRFLPVLGAAFLVTVSYLALTFPDLHLIRQATPQNAYTSYGLRVVGMMAQQSFPAAERPIALVAPLVAIGAMMIVLFIWLRGPVTLQARQERSLDAFRAGSAVFVGTFLLSNNWDYRLIFLILALPQLLEWAREGSGPFRCIARATLAGTGIMLWYGALFGLSQSIPGGTAANSLLNEACDWLVYFGLGALLVFSLPAWVRDLVRRSRRELPASPP